MVGDTITLSTFIVSNVAILHYEAIIGAQCSFVCRIGSHMMVAVSCLRGSQHTLKPLAL